MTRITNIDSLAWWWPVLSSNFLDFGPRTHEVPRLSVSSQNKKIAETVALQVQVNTKTVFLRSGIRPRRHCLHKIKAKQNNNWYKVAKENKWIPVVWVLNLVRFELQLCPRQFWTEAALKIQRPSFNFQVSYDPASTKSKRKFSTRFVWCCPGFLSCVVLENPPPPATSYSASWLF